MKKQRDCNIAVDKHMTYFDQRLVKVGHVSTKKLDCSIAAQDPRLTQCAYLSWAAVSMLAGTPHAAPRHRATVRMCVACPRLTAGVFHCGVQCKELKNSLM